ncbi:MAG: 50S ribosomal protein L18Ae [Candidatus Micrarchaeia archaeon]
MKFRIIGRMSKMGKKREFNIVVDAKNEKHAVDVALAEMGSRSRLKRSMIKIEGVERARG